LNFECLLLGTSYALPSCSFFSFLPLFSPFRSKLLAPILASEQRKNVRTSQVHASEREDPRCLFSSFLLPSPFVVTKKPKNTDAHLAATSDCLAPEEAMCVHRFAFSPFFLPPLSSPAGRGTRDTGLALIIGSHSFLAEFGRFFFFSFFFFQYLTRGFSV